MRKTVDRVVIVIITGAGVPAVDPGVRTGLDHTVRNYGSGESMSMSAGAYERIDISTIIFYTGGLCAGVEHYKSSETSYQKCL